MKTLNKILLGLALIGTLTSLSADGATLFKKCAGCHGMKAEKKALGKSHVIQGWEVSKIKTALKGYQNGTYGGPMKAVMKGQAASLKDADIKALAKYIHSLK